MEDSTRNKLDVKMYCAKHPETELRFSTHSKVGAASAYEINVKIHIHQCDQCEWEMRQLKGVLKVLDEVAKEQNSAS